MVIDISVQASSEYLALLSFCCLENVYSHRESEGGILDSFYDKGCVFFGGGLWNML